MKFRFASFVLAVYFIFGMCVVVFSGVENKDVLAVASYVCFYIIIPMCCSYGVWKHKLGYVIVSLLFFASQSIKVVNGDHWFPYPPPFSLSFPFGDFSDGQGYLFNYFAVFMVIILGYSIWEILVSDKINNHQ